MKRESKIEFYGLYEGHHPKSMLKFEVCQIWSLCPILENMSFLQ